MTAPWATAHVEADLDWGDLDQELIQRLKRSTEVASRAAQRNFDKLAAGAAKSFDRIESAYDRQMSQMERRSARAATTVNKNLDRIDRNVRVDVEIDSDGAARDLKRTTTALKAQAHANPVTIQTRVDNKPLTAMSRTLKSLGSSILGPMAMIGKLAAIGGVAALAVGALVPIVGALGVGLAAVGAAAAGGAVAGVAALGVAAVTAKVAFNGMGAAFSAAMDPEKADEFAAAMEKLTPAAQAVVRAVAGMKAEWERLGVSQAVQESFFAGLGPKIAALTRFVQPLKDALLSVADGFNDGANGALRMINTARGTAMVNTLLGESGRMGGNLAAAFAAIVPGLAAIGASATSVFAPMTDHLGQSARNLSDFLMRAQESGQMDTFFERMIGLASQVGNILGELGGIIGGVFRAAGAADAGSMFGGWLTALEQVHGWVDSFAGQNALTTFFQSAQTAVGAIVPVFLQIAQVIGTTVAPIIADLAAKLGPVLVPVIAAIGEGIAGLAPMIGMFASVLAQVLQWVTPLIPLLIQMAPSLLVMVGAFMAFSKVIKVVNMVRSAWMLLQMAFAMSPMGMIIVAVIAVVAALALFFTKTEAGRKIFETVWNAIKAVIGAVWGWLQTTVFPPLQAAFQMIGQVVMWLWQNVMMPAWNGIKAVIGIWWAAVQIYFSVLMTVIRAIGAVVMWLWNNVMLPAWNGIKAVIGVVVAIVQGYINAWMAVFRAVGAVVMWLWNNIIVPAWDGIKNAISKAVDIIGGVIDRVKAFFQGAADKAGEVKDWIVEKFNAVIDFFRELPGKIGQFADAIFEPIRSAAKAVFNGIANLWNNTVGKLSFKAPDWVPGIGGKGFSVPKIPLMRTGGLVHGLIRGPGTGTSDSVLGVGADGMPTARVSAGEFVMNARSTRMFLPLLRYLNRLRGAASIPGLAGGGVAGEPYGLPAGTNIPYGGTGFPEWVYELGRRFNVKPSTYPGHQEGSGQNRGIDWSGSVSAMQKFAEYLLSNAGDLEQVIWSNPETGDKIGVADGKRVGPGTDQPGYYSADWGGHQDHVHTRQSKGIGVDTASSSKGIDTTGSTSSLGSSSGGTPIGSGIGTSGSGSSGSSSWGNSGGGSKANSAADAKRAGLTPVWVENWPASIGGGGSSSSSSLATGGDSGGTLATGSTPSSSANLKKGATKEQMVAEVVRVGREKNMSDADIESAVATMLAESGGKNYANSNVPESLQRDHDAVGSDHKSVGVMQQQVGMGWGDVDELMDPTYAIGKYYERLGEVQGREQMSVAQRAQAVQRSGFADGSNYAAKQAEARDLIAKAGKVPVTPAGNVPVEVTNPGDLGTTPGSPGAPAPAGDPTQAAADLPDLSGSPSQIGGNLAVWGTKPGFDDFLAQHPELGDDAMRSRLSDGLMGSLNKAVSGQVGAGLNMFGLDFEPTWLATANQYMSDNTGGDDKDTKLLADAIRDLAVRPIQIIVEGGGDARAIAHEVQSKIDADRKRAMRRYIQT